MVAVNTHFDTRVFDRKMWRVDRNREPARTLAARVQADVFVGYIVTHGPRDTNRLIRSYADAGNKAGLRTRQLPPLQESRNRHHSIVNLEQAVGLSKKNVERSLQRVRNWQRQEELYRKTGRTHYKYFAKILAEKRRAERELRFHTRRLESALANQARLLSEEGKYAVTLGGFGQGAVHVQPDGQVNVRTDLMIKQKRTFTYRDGTVILKRNIQVASKVYGGAGRVEVAGDHTFVHLSSREPHARVVNHNTKYLSKALRHARSSVGARRYTTTAYTRAVTAGTGLTRAA